MDLRWPLGDGPTAASWAGEASRSWPQTWVKSVPKNKTHTFDAKSCFSVKGATDAVNELRVGMSVSHTSEPKLWAEVSDHIFDPNM